EARSQQSPSFSVVVAIDFGTTSSGYAFSFTSDPEAIHMMRAGNVPLEKGKMPGMLRVPAGAPGELERDWGQGLEGQEPGNGFQVCPIPNHSMIHREHPAIVGAILGPSHPEPFRDSPGAPRCHLLVPCQELKDQCPSLPERDAIRWVLTVPAIWKQPAKQFMREAAY
ncbi:HS12B protein, partial [Thryothorus ludovicianus]|nr:HS12B protein [Thryothorus ludovicianus]